MTYVRVQEIVKHHAFAVEMQDYPLCVVRGEDIKSALGVWPEVRKDEDILYASTYALCCSGYCTFVISLLA